MGDFPIDPIFYCAIKLRNLARRRESNALYPKGQRQDERRTNGGDQSPNMCQFPLKAKLEKFHKKMAFNEDYMLP